MDTAIIYYVDAPEGERYWRINEQAIVTWKWSLDKRISRGEIKLGECVTCQWPSRNLIYEEIR